uniref:Uncharacterized protein n=2 Tax=Candidatus Kentrum eta TaxID=2126337 RepID=A0A450VIF2_9GAMM|nr:MAG: hypothetical protein BECKH772B_GA0070898_104513 [Candidatus Kentron sp. H]VFK07760.1 MAG: hypothetical protein BECKH772C_GA0070978_104522 [Candidatus Kentron sp. H]
MDGDLSATLNHPEYRGFFFIQRTASGSTFETAPPTFTVFFGQPSAVPYARLAHKLHRTRLPMELYARFSGHYPLAQLSDHFLNVTYIQLQLTGNLAARQIQSHEI